MSSSIRKTWKYSNKVDCSGKIYFYSYTHLAIALLLHVYANKKHKHFIEKLKQLYFIDVFNNA